MLVERVPSLGECRGLLKRLKVDGNVVRHSEVVLRVAERICRGLRRKEVAVDWPLVAAACLLHDVCKL
ncbi:MAG: phosphohydrolase, partial [Candidatus Micrarchaeota archaeon]